MTQSQHPAATVVHVQLCATMARIDVARLELRVICRQIKGTVFDKNK
jgi:hypothetical protein